MLWVLCGTTAFIGIVGLINWIATGEPSELRNGIFILVWASFFLRIATVGVMVESNGLKARTFLRTYHWRWDEIEGFELLDTVYSPSLQVRLRDGRVKGVVGLAARGPRERERATKIFAELNRRLEIEHARSGKSA